MLNKKCLYLYFIFWLRMISPIPFWTEEFAHCAVKWNCKPQELHAGGSAITVPNIYHKTLKCYLWGIFLRTHFHNCNPTSLFMCLANFSFNIFCWLLISPVHFKSAMNSVANTQKTTKRYLWTQTKPDKL